MKPELKMILEDEKKTYLPFVKNARMKWVTRFTHEEAYDIYRFMISYRKAEFYRGRNKALYLWHLRKAGLRGKSLGFVIPVGTLGPKVHFYHRGIIMNPKTVIGEGCMFHGDNCVGNNGKTDDCPVLGSRVDVGIGAKIIGDVRIADDIRIGANAVVTKSFEEPGITIAGIPARKIS